MSRTIEVDWKQEHTTILVIEDDGKLSFSESSTPGPDLGQIWDHEGGKEDPNDPVFRDRVLDFIIKEVV